MIPWIPKRPTTSGSSTAAAAAATVASSRSRAAVKPPRPVVSSRSRWRKSIIAVKFFCFMCRKLLEIRWGDVVECNRNMLLESKAIVLPPNYFSKLGSCPLPPGWVSHVLPKAVLQQILTFAKNKLVMLFTPVAKLKAHRRHIQQLVAQMTPNTPLVTEQMLRDVSPFLDTLASSSFDDLLRNGCTIRAYKANSWVIPPSGTPYSSVNGLFVLKGGLLEAPGVGDWQSQGDHGPGSIVAEARAVLDSRSTVGYWAKTNTLVLEMRSSELLRIARSAVMTRERVRRYLSQQRASHAMAKYPLTVQVLRRLRFFNEFSDNDLAQFAGSSNIRVAFGGDIIVPSGSVMSSVMIILRGSIQIQPDAQDVKPFERGAGECFGEDYVVLEDRTPLAVTALGEAVDYASISSSLLLSSVKTSMQRKILSDAAAMSRQLLLPLLTSLSSLCSLLLTDPEIRMIQDVCPQFALNVARLATPCVFKVGDRIANVDDPVSTWYLLQAGKMSRILLSTNPDELLLPPNSTASHSAAAAAAISAGTGEQPSSSSSPILTAPCIVGDVSFVKKKKWMCSLTTSRLCECWAVPRAAVLHLIRSDTLGSWKLQTMIAQDQARVAQREAPASIRRHTAMMEERTSTTALPTAPHQLASDKRAAVRAKQKADQKLREAKELAEEDRMAVLRHRRLAPSAGRRTNFVEYESLRPIEPAPREAFEAVRRPEVMSPSKQVKPPKEVWMPPVADVPHFDFKAPGNSGVGSSSLTDRSVLGGTLSTENAAASVKAPTSIGSKCIFTSPGSSSSGKAQLKRVMARHKERLQVTRRAAASAGSLHAMEEANAFSTVDRHEPVPSMSPLGELYFMSPRSRSKAVPFDPAKPTAFVPVSYVSAH